jgi:prepilin-type processing-associated H-X9-DG protein
MKFFRRLNWREWMLVVVPLMLMAVLVVTQSNWERRIGLVNPFTYSGENRRLLSCQSQQRYASLDFLQYTQDYDEKFPPVISSASPIGAVALPASGWVGAVYPYGKSITNYFCPTDINCCSFNPNTKGFISYWYNSNLASIKRNDLAFPQSTLVLGEGDDGKDISDATYSKSSLPPDWIANPNSPAWRHLNGANYLMADGSVHWLRSDGVTTFGGRKNAFAVK